VRENASPESSPDELLTVLADDRRRQIVSVLLETDGVVSLDGLVAEIARRDRASEAATNRIKTMLYHSHLPLLADRGLIAYITNGEWMHLMYTGSPETTALLSDLLETDQH
jgi:hypothetical protein